MSLIINIDTALTVASVSLASNNILLQYEESSLQKEHSVWLHQTIDRLIKQQEVSTKELSAVAVTVGPGSYTGLRTGLAAAKGLCYALNIPLITIKNLLLISSAQKNAEIDFLCPCIDARRMEVYTAVYDIAMKEVIPAHALVINEKEFPQILNNRKALFCGNANEKIKQHISNSTYSFSDMCGTAKDMIPLSFSLYKAGAFANTASEEPLYLKSFYTTTGKDI